MNFFLATLFCLGTLTAFADPGKMEGRTFEEKKAHMLSRIDEKLTRMNEAKTCVSSATDETALKACHQKMKEHMKEMKKHWEKNKKK